MIRYALICEKAHEFESWFANSASYEEQAARGLVTCPHCDSSKVTRAIMSPNVARTDLERVSRPAAAEATTAVAVPSAAPAPVALMSEKEIAFRELLAAVHKHVTENAEHVGKRFAQEALKIHHGESESRPIYGEASREDAQMLHEEGVEFMPLPALPGARN